MHESLLGLASSVFRSGKLTTLLRTLRLPLLATPHQIPHPTHGVSDLRHRRMGPIFLGAEVVLPNRGPKG